MLYFLFFSNGFEQSRESELRRISEFKIVDSYRNAIIASAPADLEKKAAKAKPIFLYSIFPISATVKITEDEYLESIYKLCMKAIGTSCAGSIKAECLDLNSKRGYSAKDIEVYVGKRLEEDGFSVDLKNPDFFLYLVLMNMKGYAGCGRYAELSRSYIEPFRHYGHEYKVSRSELKLAEAFDEFGIKAKGGVALDIGAAPGGWSLFMALHGFRVIAIDKGSLDYDAIKKAGVSVKVAEDGKEAGKLLKKFEILHIKSDAAKVSFKDISDIRLLANDANLQPSESCGLMGRFYGSMGKDSEIIMTIKCATRNVENYIKEAKDGIGDVWQIDRIMALPSNRQEVMLHAAMKKK